MGAAKSRNESEWYRRKLRCMGRRLDASRLANARPAETPGTAGDAWPYAQAAELLADLELIRGSLAGNRGARLAEGIVQAKGAAREPGEGREGAGREEDLEHVRELLRLAEAFTGAGEEGVLEFLEKVTLAAEEAAGEESEAVRLMTLHNAKGLEFDVVFLVGLEDGLLPHSRSLESGEELEEERRLFYVGLTRAREKAFLSLARRRNLFGSFRDTVPSRFLYDLPSSLVNWKDAPPRRRNSGRKKSLWR